MIRSIAILAVAIAALVACSVSTEEWEQAEQWCASHGGLKAVHIGRAADFSCKDGSYVTRAPK